MPRRSASSCPQLPRLRAAALQTFRPTPALALTVAERYSDRAYGTIDNTDHYSDTFTGFSAFFVVDVHVPVSGEPAHLRRTSVATTSTTADTSSTIPYPQRTVVASLKYKY